MRLPTQSKPLLRSSNAQANRWRLLGSGGLLPSQGPFDPCTDQCIRLYGHDPLHYAACCELCGNESKVCWYYCCSHGPGCTVPP